MQCAPWLAKAARSAAERFCQSVGQLRHTPSQARSRLGFQRRMVALGAGAEMVNAWAQDIAGRGDGFAPLAGGAVVAVRW